MSKAVWKPTTLLGPIPPVLVSCGTVERPNALTIAWTGIVNTHPPMTYVSVRPSRFNGTDGLSLPICQCSAHRRMPSQSGMQSHTNSPFRKP